MLKRLYSSKKPTTREDNPPEQGSFGQQRFEQMVASDSARIQNGNIIYHGSVTHHYAGAPDVPSGSEEPQQTMDQMLAHDIRGEDYRQIKEVEEQKRLLQEALDSLPFPNMHFRHATIQSAHVETCGWILETPELTNWSYRHERSDMRSRCLWIKSKPGAGKSTIMKFIARHAEEQAKRKAERLSLKRIQQQSVDESDGEEINIYFFFNARGNQLERTAEGMYRSIIHQLYNQQTEKKHRTWLTAHNKPMLTGWEWPLEVLQTTFEDAVLVTGDGRVTCYIDALDECDEAQVRGVVSFFEQLCEQAATGGVRFRVCFASRHYPRISVKNCLEIVLEDQRGHREDIHKYISTRLRILTPDVDEIRTELYSRADGIFLWVVLAVKLLNQESDRGRNYALRQRLTEIPNGLNNVFRNILEPNGGDREDVTLILQWIMFASRPLSCQELYYAVRTGITSSAVLPAHDGLPSLETMAKFILHTSRGLAELTKGPAPVVQFIHESVRDFLAGREGLRFLQLKPVLDFAGHSHESLKTCCQMYISAGFVKRNAISLTHSELPFLRYAVQGVLYHANSAHHNNVSQDDFVQAFPANIWMSVARLTNTMPYADASVDKVCIFAEAKTEHLLRIAMSQDKRFVARPERGPERIDTAVVHEKPTDVEQLLIGDPARNDLGEDKLKPLLSMTLGARYTAVMVLLLLHNWTGQIEDELCLKFLTWALSNKHFEVVRLLVHRIVQIDDYAYSILELATEDGADILVQMLLSKHTSVDLRNRRYGRILRAAVYLGHYQIVKMMLDRGADVHFPSRRHGHILWIAAKAGHSRIVHLLCVRGAWVNRRAVEQTSSPLQVACFFRHVETVELLLQQGANVNLAGAEYGTALEAAMYWPHSDRAKLIVQMLRSYGAIM